MGLLVMVAYRPRVGMEQRLLELVKEHVPRLRHEQLATDRDPLVMRAGDGTLIEVFEWQSADAIHTAHANAAVQAMWEQFGAACEYETLANLPECQGLFATFEPVEL